MNGYYRFGRTRRKIRLQRNRKNEKFLVKFSENFGMDSNDWKPMASSYPYESSEFNKNGKIQNKNLQNFISHLDHFNEHFHEQILEVSRVTINR